MSADSARALSVRVGSSAPPPPLPFQLPPEELDDPPDVDDPPLLPPEELLDDELELDDPLLELDDELELDEELLELDVELLDDELLDELLDEDDVEEDDEEELLLDDGSALLELDVPVPAELELGWTIGFETLVGSVMPTHPAARAAGALTSNSRKVRRARRSTASFAFPVRPCWRFSPFIAVLLP